MSNPSERIVFHIDFDYFFAQCEELRQPELKGRPVVVCVYSGRTEDSGAVSTANYEARKYNVKSGIPIRLAKSRLKEVQDAKFLPVDHGYYEEMSGRAMSIIKEKSDRFELVGIDEAFIDVSKRCSGDYSKAQMLAEDIKRTLREELNLTCSVGVAPNKLVAKIASDFNKPDGLTVVKPEEVEGFLSKLEVGKISGIGKKTEQRLNEMDVKTVGELSGLDIYTLTKEFGKKNGTYIFNASRGIDDDPVVEDDSVTQLSRIITLKKNTSSLDELLPDLEYLCRDVHRSAKEQNFWFRSVGIMMILDDLSMKTKARTLKAPSDSYDELFKIAKNLLAEALHETDLLVRRLGVKVSELTNSRGQDTLFKFME